jgi:hypothetical protein
MSSELRVGLLPRARQVHRSGSVAVAASGMPRPGRRPGRGRRLGTVLAVAVLVSLLMWAGIIALVLALVR